MQATPLSILGSWLFSPVLHKDDRGVFLESFSQHAFHSATGRELDVQQANVSASSRGTVRGIHFADVPPSQAKYVQCFAGRILDVVVDLRIGSPTFGRWDLIELNSDAHEVLYISEGLGHAFCAISNTATVGYMCSAPYTPEREHGINPLDSDLGIPWPSDIDLRLSPKDAAAPTLAEARSMGVLPSYTDCVTHYKNMQAQRTL